MNVKTLLRQLLPPALVTLLKQKSLNLGYYWKGFYSYFHQVVSSGPCTAWPSLGKS